MGDSGVQEYQAEEQIDWEHLFANLPGDESFFDAESNSFALSDFLADNPVKDFSNLTPDHVYFSIGNIEELLMDDDNAPALDVDPNPQMSGDFISGVLLASPVDSHVSPSPDVVDVSDGNNSNISSEEKIDAVRSEENNHHVDDGDPTSKKRKRQLRNRDAAIRSRERKKMYVKELEMKSRYFEAECKRLGMLLQCCFAENQALRLSLQNVKGYGASMTKQESAVLLLESLLLGSLFWFLGIMCLLILPTPTLEAAPMEGVDEKSWETLAPIKAGSESQSLLVFSFTMMGKRCKASRSRMKSSSSTLGLV